MRTKILSPQGITFEGEASLFNVQTEMGEVTILDHHHPLIAILKPGASRLITTSGEEKNYSIDGGFLEVSDDNQLTVLIN